MTGSTTRGETSAGGVVFRCGSAGPRYLLIFDRHGNWGFPKGHVEEGEDPAATARREVREETGLGDLILHRPLGTIDWFFQSAGRRIHKYCQFFLFESPAGTPAPQNDEGIEDCDWFSPGTALAQVTHENARSLLARADQEVRSLCAAGTQRP